jgi:hypothetical protein
MAISDGPRRRCSQRDIREGRAPRRLAERGFSHHMQGAGTSGAGGAHFSRQLAVAFAVLVLVIASTVVSP